MNLTINLKKIFGLVAILGLLAFAGMAISGIAEAHEDPVDCNAVNMQQTPLVSPSGVVYDGDTLTYSVTYSNLDPDGAGGTEPCNVTDVDAEITLPDSTVINVLVGATLNVGDTISCPGGAGCAAGPYTYNVDHSDEIGGAVAADFDIEGTRHGAVHTPATDSDSLPTLVIHPSTITTITSDSATVAAGDTVMLTITEENDGDIALTNPAVSVDNGVGILTAAPDSGDTGNDGVLGAGETWTWTVESPVINSDITFVATGSGNDPNNNDITYCEEEIPDDGIICDLEEQDSVEVLVVNPLVIEKTAETTYDREWDWTIEKTGTDSELLLAEGETYTVSYDVEVDATSTDVGHTVSGQITVMNPLGNPSVEITDVADELNDSGDATTLTCEDENADTTAPWTLSAGETLTCDYEKTGANTDDDLNTATVTTDGTVPGGEATADVVWGDPADEIDECIDVNDTVGGFLGTVCADEAPQTLEYNWTFGPEGGEGVDEVIACDDDFVWPNIADFVANDTDQVGSDNWDVHVVVDCFEGCTLTQGYWKTHSELGPAPEDMGGAWPAVGGPDQAFSDTNPIMTWYEIFWTPPQGNAWYNLAHQYMAAVLNTENEASVPTEVQDAINEATLLLTQENLDALDVKGKAKKAVKELSSNMISLAGILGSYNEGEIGPGHCDEQNPEDEGPQ